MQSFGRTMVCLVAVILLVGAGEQSDRTGVTPQPGILIHADTIRSEISPCASCPLLVRRQAAFGSESDPVLLSHRSRLTTLPGGSVVVFRVAEPGRLLIYDETGDVEGIVGRAGEGPGEYAGPDHVVAGPGDSVHVFDGFRWMVHSPGVWGSPASTRRVPLFHWAGSPLLLPDGGVILHGGGGPGNRAFHRVAASGAIRASFGGALGGGFTRFKLISGGRGGGHVWSVTVSRYEIERWNVMDGRLEQVLVRNADWFEPWEEEGTAVGPRIMDIVEDRSGLIRLLIRVPASPEGRDGPNQNRRSLREREQTAGGRSGGLRKSAAAWNSVVEIVDPATATLVASQRLQQDFSAFDGPDHLVLRTENDRGVVALERWSLRFPY